MKKEPKIFLQHILESIEKIEEYAKNVTEKEFFDDYEKQDAIVKRLEIIGEAVKNLPDSLKNKHPNVPWKNIAGTRDILIHEYFGIDTDLIWEIVRKNIPRLKKQIIKILKN